MKRFRLIMSGPLFFQLLIFVIFVALYLLQFDEVRNWKDTPSYGWSDGVAKFNYLTHSRLPPGTYRTLSSIWAVCPPKWSSTMFLVILQPTPHFILLRLGTFLINYSGIIYLFRNKNWLRSISNEPIFRMLWKDTISWCALCIHILMWVLSSFKIQKYGENILNTRGTFFYSCWNRLYHTTWFFGQFNEISLKWARFLIGYFKCMDFYQNKPFRINNLGNWTNAGNPSYELHDICIYERYTFVALLSL